MEQVFAKNLMNELGIDMSRLVQEEWEVKILNYLFASLIGKNLIFKGGTALRLAYGSPRFSEDLDFSLIRNTEFVDFEKAVQKILSSEPKIKLLDIYSKYYTFYAKLQIAESWLPRKFSIKIEISKRSGKEKFELRTLSSPTTNIQVLANVQTTDQIMRDKLDTIKNRAKPRDFFDLWYLQNLLKLPAAIPKSDISSRDLKSELRKFLPKNYWSAIDQIKKEITR